MRVIRKGVVLISLILVASFIGSIWLSSMVGFMFVIRVCCFVMMSVLIDLLGRILICRFVFCWGLVGRMMSCCGELFSVC